MHCVAYSGQVLKWNSSVGLFAHSQRLPALRWERNLCISHIDEQVPQFIKSMSTQAAPVLLKWR